MYDYSKLIGRIIEKYKTRRDFAKALGLSMTSLSQKLNGKKGFSQKDILKWCELLDIDTEECGLYFFALKV